MNEKELGNYLFLILIGALGVLFYVLKTSGATTEQIVLLLLIGFVVLPSLYLIVYNPFVPIGFVITAVVCYGVLYLVLGEIYGTLVAIIVCVLVIIKTWRVIKNEKI